MEEGQLRLNLELKVKQERRSRDGKELRQHLGNHRGAIVETSATYVKEYSKGATKTLNFINAKKRNIVQTVITEGCEET